MTVSLNHNVSNLILDTIHPIIKMRMRVIYSFSYSIYQGWNQVIQYHKTLSPSGTFTSLSQVEEYIKQCKLRCLNLGNDDVWSKAYLPASQMTNNPRVSEGYIKFHHVRIQLISLNELLLGSSPLPDWLSKK